MESALYDRALDLLRAGCPESRDTLRFHGVSIVYELGKPSHLALLLRADRDRVTNTEAEAAAIALTRSVSHAEPALVDRLRWSVMPYAPTAAINAQQPIDAACERLASYLTEHEVDCAEHRDPRGYLFIPEVEACVGWSREDDHLLAWFCVDGSGVTKADEACCSRAMAVLKEAMPELPAIRWQCTPYR